MKAIVIVRERLKPDCFYAVSTAWGYSCSHDVAKDLWVGQIKPDEPCTIEDWGDCPLNDKKYRRVPPPAEPKEGIKGL